MMLLSGERPLHLSPKSVSILYLLARHAGQVVSKERIMAEVWPDRVVEESNLKQHIAVIRRALEAEPGSAACRAGEGVGRSPGGPPAR